MQHAVLPAAFERKKKVFEVVVWEGCIQPRLSWETPAYITLSHKGNCCLPRCLLLIELLMTVVAGKSVTAIIGAGKHRDPALDAELAAALVFETAGQEGWDHQWYSGVGCGRPESSSQIYHSFLRELHCQQPQVSFSVTLGLSHLPPAKDNPLGSEGDPEMLNSNAVMKFGPRQWLIFCSS